MQDLTLERALAMDIHQLCSNGGRQNYSVSLYLRTDPLGSTIIGYRTEGFDEEVISYMQGPEDLEGNFPLLQKFKAGKGVNIEYLGMESSKAIAIQEGVLRGKASLELLSDFLTHINPKIDLTVTVI